MGVLAMMALMAMDLFDEDDEPAGAAASSTSTASSVSEAEGDATEGESVSPTSSSAAATQPDRSTSSSTEATRPGEPEMTLTAANNKDFAAVLASRGDNKLFSKFATKYEGRDIQFDGVVLAIGPHGDYETRYNILIIPGDDPYTETNSVSFQFRNQNIVQDLKMTGPNIPDYLRVGDQLRVTATVDEYVSDLELMVIEPVRTEYR